MTGNSRQGFILSILLHLGVGAVVVFLALFKPPVEPVRSVFELVAPPPSEADIASDDAAVEFNVPRTRPPAPQPKPVERPKPPEPKPVVVPKPVQQTVPEKPKPAEEKPVPPPKVSYEEFVKQHGQPTPQKPKPATPKPVTVPRLNTKFTANLRETVINIDASASLSDAELDALDRYIARLREALRRAWDKPTSLAENLATTVEFEIAANGRLTGVRITRGSGNSQFDQSVLGAFNTLGSAGATPDARPQQLRLTFRMTDA